MPRDDRLIARLGIAIPANSPFPPEAYWRKVADLERSAVPCSGFFRPAPRLRLYSVSTITLGQELRSLPADQGHRLGGIVVATYIGLPLFTFAIWFGCAKLLSVLSLSATAWKWTFRPAINKGCVTRFCDISRKLIKT